MGLLASVLLTLLLAPGAPSATVAPSSGPAGSRITVTGTGFDPGPVDIRWGGASGPVIGAGMGPDFTVEATVPDEPAGTRSSVVAVPRDGGEASAPAAFVVAPPAGGDGRSGGVGGGGLGGVDGGADEVPAPAPADQAAVAAPRGTEPAGGFGATPDDDDRASGRAGPAADDSGGGLSPAVILVGALLLLGLAGVWRRRRRTPPAPDNLWG